MGKIPLGKGKFALVDDEDFEKVNQYKWHHTEKAVCRSNYIGYKDLSKPKISSNQKKESIFIHRFILNVIDEKIEIDHINGDILDNRRRNLRKSTHHQNMMNIKTNRKNNKSGYKGVCWDASRSKWRAYIVMSNRQINLGYFAEKVDAAKAYNAKAKELFGDFARANDLIAEQAGGKSYRAKQLRSTQSIEESK